MKKTALLALFFLLFGLSPSIASAEQICAPRTEIVRKLEQSYKEAQSGLGIEWNGSLYELFTTQNGSTWTLIQTLPSGFACVVATGNRWEKNADVLFPPEPEGDDQ